MLDMFHKTLLSVAIYLDDVWCMLTYFILEASFISYLLHMLAEIVDSRSSIKLTDTLISLFVWYMI